MGALFNKFGAGLGAGSGLFGGGSGGGGNVDLQSILDMLSQGTNQANIANQARLDELRQGNAARRQQALSLFNGLGQTEGRLIQERGQQQIAQSGQDLTSRGLSGTTIRQSNQQAINRDTQSQQTLLSERVASQKFGALDRIASDRQGFIERVQDVGPDPSAFAGLLTQLGINQSQQGQQKKSKGRTGDVRRIFGIGRLG